MGRSKLMRTVVSLAVALMVFGLAAIPAGASKAPPTSIPLAELDLRMAPQAPAQGQWEIFPPANFSTSSLNALALMGANDAWIAGDGGRTWRWNGTAWNEVSTPVTFDLNWIDNVPGGQAGEAWAAGLSQNHALHFVNGAWTDVQMFGLGESLGQVDSVWINSTTDGWMVGAQGKILRYTGGENWSIIPPITNVQLHDVETTSDGSSGWAVGEDGVILRWNGTAWSQATSPTALPLFNVVVVSADEAWAVGGVSGNGAGSQAVILHWINGTWTVVTSPANVHLWSIDMVSASDGWITGDGGTILHYNGTAWVLWQNVTQSSLFDVEMLNATTGWIVGASPTTGSILRLGAGQPPPPPVCENCTPRIWLPGLFQGVTF